MDKYHIYEEVGSGQHSQVFKGREKMDIEFVAIKRVEKSRMESVVQEVQVRPQGATSRIWLSAVVFHVLTAYSNRQQINSKACTKTRMSETCLCVGVVCVCGCVHEIESELACSVERCGF